MLHGEGSCGQPPGGCADGAQVRTTTRWTDLPYPRSSGTCSTTTPATARAVRRSVGLSERAATGPTDHLTAKRSNHRQRFYRAPCSPARPEPPTNPRHPPAVTTRRAGRSPVSSGELAGAHGRGHEPGAAGRAHGLPVRGARGSAPLRRPPRPLKAAIGSLEGRPTRWRRSRDSHSTLLALIDPLVPNAASVLFTHPCPFVGDATFQLVHPLVDAPAVPLIRRSLSLVNYRNRLDVRVDAGDTARCGGHLLGD
jgi:hypothetical protein